MTKIDIHSMTAALESKMQQRAQQQQQILFNQQSTDFNNTAAGAPSLINTRDNSSTSNSSYNSNTVNTYTQQYQQNWTYSADGVIGNGSFGVVYMATVVETGELVAIKKVLQDKKFKNRELQLMCAAQYHPCIIQLKHCFYSKNTQNGVESLYLNLVMEYVNDTLYHCCKLNKQANKYIPSIYVKSYMYQLLRGLAHLHRKNICHRDIKPHNILLNTKTHEVKLCDFGSAKQLVRNEVNVAYICSRFYRAPELIFESTNYTNSIDVWSLGCVFGEILKGSALFTGDTGIDQLIEIIKLLGTPTPTQVLNMCDKPTTIQFPQLTKIPWTYILRHNKSVDNVTIDLLEHMLQYNPVQRIQPFIALTHTYFNELRQYNTVLPNGKQIPHLYDYTPDEIQHAYKLNILHILIPKHAVHNVDIPTHMLHVYNIDTTMQDEKTNSPIKGDALAYQHL